MRTPASIVLAVAGLGVVAAGLGFVGSDAPGASAPTALVGHSTRPVIRPLAGTTPAAALRLSTTAMTKATSVNVQGLTAVPTGFEAVDLVITRTGAVGTVGSTGRGTCSVVRTGATLYLNCDAEFWAAPGRTRSAALAGRWFVATGTGPVTQDLRRRTTLGYWAHELAVLPFNTQQTGKVIRKAPAVALVAPGARNATVYLAATGQPYPLRVLTPDETFIRDYLGWNKAVTLPKLATRLVATV